MLCRSMKIAAAIIKRENKRGLKRLRICHATYLCDCMRELHNIFIQNSIRRQQRLPILYHESRLNCYIFFCIEIRLNQQRAEHFD